MIIRRISIINIKNKKDILEMIAFEITQYVPININNYIIKYKILDSDISNLNLQVILLPKYLADLCQEISNVLNMKPISLSINYDILQKMIDLELIEGFNDNAIFIEYKDREIILNMTKNRKIYESYILPRTNESHESLANISNGFDNIYYYGVEDPYIEQTLKNSLNIQPLRISARINILKNQCDYKEEYIKYIKYINSIGMII